MRISDWSSDVCSSDLQYGAAGPYRLHGVQGKRQMCMRWMRPFPQGVDHPDVQPVVQRQHIGRYIVEISGISNGMAIMREAESGGEYLAMGLIGAGDADVPDAQSVGQRLGFARRVIAMASVDRKSIRLNYSH